MPDIHWIEGNPPPGLAIVIRPQGDDRLEGELRTVQKCATRVVMLYPRARLQGDEKQILYDGPPVAPKNTRASEWRGVTVSSLFRWLFQVSAELEP